MGGYICSESVWGAGNAVFVQKIADKFLSGWKWNRIFDYQSSRPLDSACVLGMLLISSSPVISDGLGFLFLVLENGLVFDGPE